MGTVTSVSLLSIATLLVVGACVAAPGAAPGTTAPSPAPSANVSASPTTPAATMAPERFWAGLFSGEPEAINYPSLGALIKASDAVVLGSFSGVEPGPDSDAGSGNTNRMATVRLDVERVLHGSLPDELGGRVPVAVFLGISDTGGENPYASFIEQLAASMPAERGVFFLVNMADYYAQFDPSAHERYDATVYQVVSAQGLVRDVRGVAQIPANAPGAWPRAMNGRPFEAIAREIETTETQDGAE